MLYTQCTFAVALPDWQRALFEQDLADVGFEAFCETETDKDPVSLAYIQTSIFQRKSVEQVVADYEGVSLLSAEECPDENWNQTWEQEHPEFTIELPNTNVLIQSHCAFGAGYHETTSMLVQALIQHYTSNTTHHTPYTVLDNGCGTGILGIVASKLGAQHITMVDIDDKSVSCAIENCQRNNLPPSSYSIQLGSTPPEGKYDLILSNIHKNVLIAQMPLYARLLNPDGQVWLSGFYASDVPDLLTAAQAVGLHQITMHQSGDWCMLQLTINTNKI